MSQVIQVRCDLFIPWLVPFQPTFPKGTWMSRVPGSDRIKEVIGSMGVNFTYKGGYILGWGQNNLS